MGGMNIRRLIFFYFDALKKQFLFFLLKRQNGQQIHHQNLQKFQDMIILVIKNSTFFLCFIKSSHSKGDQYSRKMETNIEASQKICMYMCVFVLLLTSTGTGTGSDARTVAVTVFVNRTATYIVTFRNIHTKLENMANVRVQKHLILNFAKNL